MRDLVTGAAGFIGSHVARHCLGMGHEVVVLDDLSGGFLDQVPDTATFVQGSITDHDLVGRVFAEYQPDYVYHLAAYAAEGLSHFIRRFNYANNLIGSVNLITDRETGRLRGFGFVEMSDDAGAKAAIEGLNGKEIAGRTLTVNEARPKTSRGGGGGPRGGGGGGRRW